MLNEVQKSRNLTTCHVIACGGCGKKFIKFRGSCDTGYLKPKHPRMWSHLKTLKVLGMKSHDFHIWIERLLPAMTRGYLPDPVWRVLAELSYFFRQLCARELSRAVILDLERVAPLLLCKLEMIFPPGFFCRCNIRFCTYRVRHNWGVPCRPVGAIQSRGV